MHHLGRQPLSPVGRFSPREGYGLHRPRQTAGTEAQEVSVPVRGMDCIVVPLAPFGWPRVSVPVRGMDCIVVIGSYRGFSMVSVPVRGMDCICSCRYPKCRPPRGFSPREGYGLHRQVCTNRSFVLQHLVQSIFNTIAQFGNDCNVFCVILPTFPVGVCIFLCANPFQCMQDRWANMAVRTKNLQGSLNCLFPVADPML